MDTTQIYINYLKQVLLSPQKAQLDISALPEEDQQFAEILKEFCDAVIEGYLFSVALSDGQLNIEFDGRNPFIGALKELQAGLRHFSWQITQVAKGDYSHCAEFLGGFSDAFNEMVQQLIQRQELLIQNHKLEMKIKQQAQETLQSQLEQQKAHYQSLNDMNRNIRAFRHDTKNHYLCLDSLLAHGEIEQARKYLASISTVVHHNVKIINTENHVFDALMTEKILIAQAAGIQVEQSIQIRPNIKVNYFDWSILLGNAMDNAIEACCLLNPAQLKKIQIHIKTKKNILNIAIKNTSLPPKTDEQGNIITSKSDIESHGFGLLNIKNTVEKYDGVLKTQYVNECFVISMMLCDV